MTTQTVSSQRAVNLRHSLDLGELVPVTATQEQSYNRDIRSHNTHATSVAYCHSNLLLVAVLVVVTAGCSAAQMTAASSESSTDTPLSVSADEAIFETTIYTPLDIVPDGDRVDSPTGQIHCQGVIEAEIQTQTIAANLEFIYPQRLTAVSLDVQLGIPDFDTEADDQKAWFSTAGEDSYWTVPVFMGVAPVVITLVAAPRDSVNDRFLAEFSGYPTVPIICEPL